ncbi:hypothetical protein SUGI_0459440 [Cryptomeria japonica]|nr:hypothetical protein SUGI_0459440 [Cryptomeria japonica]
MHCRAVVRFVICAFLVGFTAAKCVPERCGDLKVSYPFWIHNQNCGKFDPDFHIECKKDEDTGMMAPFLPACYRINGIPNTTAYYRIWEIDYSGYIVISSSSLEANS